MWILKRIEDRLSKNPSFIRSEKNITTSDAVEKIFKYFLGGKNCDDKTKKLNRIEIANDCDVFVRDLGITHYVSSIELGAISYNAENVSSKQKKVGGGAEVRVDGYASGGLSGIKEKLWFQSQKEERLIGKIKDKRVAEVDEAVIGFQIQPISSLAPVPFLQPALFKAVKEYIQKKADLTGGLWSIYHNICMHIPSMHVYQMHVCYVYGCTVCEHNYINVCVYVYIGCMQLYYDHLI